MTCFRIIHRNRSAYGLLCTLALAACGVAMPPKIALGSATPQLPATVFFNLAGAEGQALSPQLESFAAKFAAALARHGVQQSPQSAYKLTIALSIRSAEMGLAQEGKGSPQWLSEPRKHQWYHGCRAKRLEVTLSSQGSGTDMRAISARGEIDGCTFGSAALENLAESLAARLTAP